MKLRTLIFVLVLTLVNFINQTSTYASDLNACKIDAPKIELSSLGFPIKIERLVHKQKANVLVIPYKLKDAQPHDLSAKEKDVFLAVSKNINDLSNGKNQVKFSFTETIELDKTTREMDYVSWWQQKNWNENNFDGSTWGFVYNTLLTYDKNLDFSNQDAAILIGFSDNSSAAIGEAMQFTDDPEAQSGKKRQGNVSWVAPIKTSEGVIANSILLYNLFDEHVVTHELLHLYGLVDLYGAPSYPPFSWMSSGSFYSLLPYEKWILGWLPDASVYCRDSKIDLYKEEKNISLNFQYSIGDQSYLIPISSRSLLVIDFIKYKDIYNLVSYQLDIDNRPAIKSFQIYNKPQQKSLDLSNFGGIAEQFISDNFTILVTNNNEKMVSVNVISEVSTNIEQKKLLVSSAEANRQEAEKILKSKKDAAVAPINSVEPAKNQVVKKVFTITCVKGKVAKKITGSNPICPNGYKKK